MKEIENLQNVIMSDLFVGRVKKELPDSLKHLAMGMQGKSIIELDLSDNAFGPAGVKGFDFMLKELSALKVLRITNCGLGPEGGSLIADALLDSEIRLEEFSAGRDRLEDKGISALANAFQKMGSLHAVKVPQNGIKKEGMLALLKALKQNECLRTMWINDNWLKEEAVDLFCELLETHKHLKEIDVSDCNIGEKNSIKVFSALKNTQSPIGEFIYNYNELEEKKNVAKCLENALLLQSLRKLSVKGIESKKQGEAFKKQFKENEREFVYLSEEEEDEDEAEESEEEDKPMKVKQEEKKEEKHEEKPKDEAKELEKALENLDINNEK